MLRTPRLLAGRRPSGPMIVSSLALVVALGGTPASGWMFSVVLTGQDGFSSDQARGFQPTPQDYQFGVCRVGVSSPICGVPPGTVPKAVDVLTPAGVSQADELDPTLHAPVTIAGVTIP